MVPFPAIIDVVFEGQIGEPSQEIVELIVQGLLVLYTKAKVKTE